MDPKEQKQAQEFWNMITRLSRENLKEIVWNFTMIRASDNYKEAKRLLKDELRIIKKNK